MTQAVGQPHKAEYLRIRPEFLMRGWKGLPCALVSRRTGEATFMRRSVFEVLQLCDGSIPASDPVFSGLPRLFLRQLNQQGFLERLDEPGALLPEQKYRTFDNRYVGTVLWSLTGHCNYRCRHCYMSAPRAVFPQPTTEQCLDLADQLAECGATRIALTGGAPLVRQDFQAIVDRILERGMHVDVIMTNGSLVDERLLDALDARGCRPEISMSFDGPEYWHDWLRGVPGAYESVRRALVLCHERGFVTESNLVLHKGNVHLLREIVRELGELGVSSLKVSRLNCIGEGAALTKYALSAKEELEAYLAYIPQYVADGMPVPVLKLSELFNARFGAFGVGIERGSEDRDCSKRSVCADARHALFIGPDRRIMPCCSLSEHECTNGLFPTVDEMKLSEALSSPAHTELLNTTLADYLEHNPHCASCVYRNRCGGGCRACAAAANAGRDLLGRDPYACLIFRGGYYDRAKALVAQLQEA